MDIINLDIERTIRTYDYTKRAVCSMNDVVDSEDFYEKDAEAIFEYLTEKMQIVFFGDYLKRYIYEFAEMEDNFSDIPEEEYIAIIDGSFDENRAPHYFQPTTRKWSVILKSFVRSNSITRDQMFLLGFGLNMPDEDVSMFLTKVLKEQDFNFVDPKEAIFWYCYHKGLPYLQAKKLLDYYENSQGLTMEDEQRSSIEMNPKVYLSNEQILKEYLDDIKYRGGNKGLYDIQFDIFMDLYNKCIGIITDIYEDDSDSYHKDASRIGAADLEKILYAGIPVNDKGNLMKMSASVLNEQFDKKRMRRQRIEQLLSRKVNVDRFDIITLLFFIYATTIEPDWPTERNIQYIDEANHLLEECHFMGIYPVNPYDTFLLMCLLTEDAMYAFNEIWALSYEEE